MFNPVSYELLDKIGWRFVFLTMGCLVFALGIPAALTYTPPGGDNVQQFDLNKVETTKIVSMAKVTLRVKIILGSAWFLASCFTAVGYYTPVIYLVLKLLYLQ
eukprot:GHVR01069663.1.p1 GENE.GHVR01069663.1~~GHVR01069663.1.p1  ORF type:complete len:103 (+),score=3.24 GHVR01069663.1:34-342(+)